MWKTLIVASVVALGATVAVVNIDGIFGPEHVCPSTLQTSVRGDEQSCCSTASRSCCMTEDVACTAAPVAEVASPGTGLIGGAMAVASVK